MTDAHLRTRSPRRRVLFALAVVAVFAATVWLLFRAFTYDDLPWTVWKLEGPAKRGTTALPVLRVAERPDGDPIRGDWQSVVTSRGLDSDGKVDRIWEALHRQRTPGWFWRWRAGTAKRHWLVWDCSYSEAPDVVTTTAGHWRRFVRDPLPGDTWCRRPDPALVGHWTGSFVENWPHRSSSLEFRADGSVEGLVEMPGTWGTDGTVLILTWGGDELRWGYWQGRRAGTTRFTSFEGAFGSLEKD